MWASTPSNFGHSGQTPSNPDLLDDLSVRFMENGWSVKWLVREIVLSSTYRQTSSGKAGAAKDPENLLLWRMNRKRLSVEHPTGEFTVELTLGGPSAAPEVTSAALLRTARWLFDGAVGIPAAVWQEAT